MKNYCKRAWLNPKNHPSTGSVVAYHGESPWLADGQEFFTMLEVSDCHRKARIHRADKDSVADFIKKMEKLNKVITDFITHLKELEAKG